jgi:general secretion pathway protein B
MSFILDALRKSELERQRQSGPIIAEFPIARADRRLPWALLAIGVLLAINVGVLLYFLLRDTASSNISVDLPAAAAPVTAAPKVKAPPVAAAPAVALPPPAHDMAAVGAVMDEADVPGTQVMPGPASFPPPAPDPTLLPATPTSPAYATRIPAGDSPPSIDELPAQATAGLPELSIDLHIYTDDPAKRAVFINGRRYQQGAVLAEGPTVDEITRDGAVLRHQGRLFLLPRQ